MVKARDDEDEFLENEEDDIEDDNDSDDESGAASKKEKKAEPEDDIEIVDDEAEKKDERIQTQGRKSFKDETPDEKRARRRRERQLKKGRDYANRRELDNVKQMLARLAKENEELKSMAGEFGKREATRDEQQIDSAIESQRSLYRTAQEQLSKAITEGDGAAAAHAQSILNDASNKFNQLTQLKATAQNSRKAEVEKKPDAAVKDTRLQVMYTQRFLAQNDWFDPAGGDEDSKTAKEIDSEVAAEGYDPNTREYWDEVKKRIKDELPHLFDDDRPKRQQTNSKPRPKQTSGSFGAEGTSSGAKKTTIPARVVEMAKAAGQWEDKKIRDKFIENYKAANPQAGQ